MSFVNPWILLAVVAAGIPVLFHLWKRKRLVPKRWGAFRLLEQVETKSRRAQLERWLLLALRMAIIALLVVAFARPAGNYGLLAGGSGQRKHVVIVWDNSYSMARKINDTSMFELARERILEDLDRLQFDRATLVMMSDRTSEPLTGFTSNRAVLQELVETSQQSRGATNAVAGLERAVGLLSAEQAEDGLVLLYHDFQDNAWQRDALDRFNNNIQDRGLQIAAVHLQAGAGDHDNQTLADLTWSQEILSPGMPVTLSVLLHNHDSAERERDLNIEMDRVNIHHQLVTIPPALDGKPGELLVEIPVVAPAQGPHRGTVQLSPDALTEDNVRHFALSVVPQLSVLLVDGFPQLDPSQNASFFAAHLLNEAVTGNTRPRVMPLFDIAAVDFDDFDVVILANVPRLSAVKFAELQAFVERGGGVIYFLGDQVDPDDFRSAYTFASVSNGDQTQTNTSSSNSSALESSVTGVEVDSPQLRSDRIRVPQGLFPGYPTRRLKGRFQIDIDRSQFEHPLLRRMQDVKADLPTAEFTQLFDFEVLDATNVPIRVRSMAGDAADDGADPDGYPLVVERTYGAGRILIFTSSCDRKWNDMLLTPSAAPLLLQAVYHVSGVPALGDSNVLVGDDVVIPFPLDQVDRSVAITRPDQSVQDVFTQSTAIGVAAAIYSEASQVGNYRFELKPSLAAINNVAIGDNVETGIDSPGIDEGHNGYFAVNFVSDESATATVEPEQIMQRLSNAEVTLRAEDLLASPGTRGIDSWLILVLIGVIVLCGECWLANKNL